MWYATFCTENEKILKVTKYLVLNTMHLEQIHSNKILDKTDILMVMPEQKSLILSYLTDVN